MRFPFKIPENKKFDAAGFGTNAVDYLIQVPAYPPFNSKVRLTNYAQMAGGEIATTMSGLARLGLQTCYAGRFGDDREGDFGMESLRGENVNIDFAERIAGAKTQIGFIIIDEQSGERTVIWERDEKLAYNEEDAPVEIAEQCRVFHATPHDAQACTRMAREAKNGGAVISIDIDNLFDGIENLLPLVDVFVSSETFPEKLTGIADPKDSLRAVKSHYGCAVAGMTLGERGSLFLCENEFIETKGFAVPGGCKDTTGAGDAFRVGLLYGMLTGETIETSTKMANAVAALKCRELGARTALPNRNELFDLIQR